MKKLLLSLFLLLAFAGSAGAGQYVGCFEQGDTVPLTVQHSDTQKVAATGTSRTADIINPSLSVDTSIADGGFANVAGKTGLDSVSFTIGAGDEIGPWWVLFSATVDGVAGLVDVDTFYVRAADGECGAVTADIVDDVWDEGLTGATHNVPTSSGRRLRNLGDAVQGTIDDASATTTSFITDLTGTFDDHYGHLSLTFTSGNLTGISKIVNGYTASTKLITVEDGFPEAPADNDEFTIGSIHTHPIQEVADHVWDEVLSKTTHNVGQSAGKRLRQLAALISADASINDVSPTLTSFVTTLTSTLDDFYVDQVLVITDDTDLIGQGRVISAYNGTTKEITVDEDFSQIPLDGSDFVIFSPHVHPVSQISDAVLDATVDGTRTMREILCALAATQLGKSSGMGTPTITFRNIDDDTTVVTGGMDSSFNRVGPITLILSGCN